MDKIKIGVIVGSSREGSVSMSLAKGIMNEFPEEIEAKIIKINHLPFYEEDFDRDLEFLPVEVKEFREEIKALDGVLFVTPEYNRSMPAVLKNAVDIASRPYSDNAWLLMPAAIASQSPGNIGGYGANQHLRAVLSVLNMPVMNQPEIYFANSMSNFEDGKPANERTEKALARYAKAMTEHFKKNLK